ncbi:site-specific integrase [Burkholderia cepacia]|uniref:Site-specific integrase n=1 Tax=Burkholderia cepacia TaxID=292 RepID=A0AAX2RRI1_BURCE|nr:site-specific integrase [Burkholderia cepacia]TET01683.1 site-specific integrase [Burkholderia cepacia]TEU47541.1 site-specific integrase [Burkholderia cepacia]TEU53568.1 site-specific integrase [Burkholderia cepacia]TEV02174.1 site-specific integrase [Burkholderia cepacia]TEV07985.1 site-specific integrase [Burkholderia cepacia]
MKVSKNSIEDLIPPQLTGGDHPHGKHNSRSLQTQTDYLAKAKSIVSRVKSHYGIDESDPDMPEFQPSDIVAWMDEKRGSYRRDTWRFYRAALIYQLEMWAEADTSPARTLALRCIEAIANLRALRWASAPANQGKTAAQRSRELPNRTSSSKRKSVPHLLFAELTTDMHRPDRGNWARRAILLASATVYAGLRPSEWFSASIDVHPGGAKAVVKVRNAKSTNGRGNGEHREILIDSADAIEAIEANLDAIGSWMAEPGHSPGSAAEHPAYQAEMSALARAYDRGCSQAMRDAQVRLWGKSRGITPYSFRHQFSANAKADGRTKREIADLMGHGSSETAGIHYGRKRHGYSNLAPEDAQRAPRMVASSPTAAQTSPDNDGSPQDAPNSRS